MNRIFNCDSRKILEELPLDTRVQTTITSPPYFDMKNYGSENQIGYGQTYEEYLKDLQEIFAKIISITEEDGTLWIIIDTFKRNNQVVTLPFDLSNKLKEVGWQLQDVIIWKKDKTVPWSVNGFMQRKFEYILFFSKTINFKSNKDNVRVYDTSQLKKWWVKYPERYNPKGKALDEIWEFPIPTQGSWGDKYIRHFCPLPQAMVATMIQISTDEGDTVLDPFSGTGTVLSQSAYMNRNYIGFELNAEYIEMFNNYLKSTFESQRREFQLSKLQQDQNWFEDKILDLRALKYAKIVLNNIDKIRKEEYIIAVEIIGKSEAKNKILKVEYEFIGDIRCQDISDILENLTKKPPLSKFGIEPIFKFTKQKYPQKDDYFCYTKTNTHSFIQPPDLKKSVTRIISSLCVDLNENDYS